MRTDAAVARPALSWFDRRRKHLAAGRRKPLGWPGHLNLLTARSRKPAPRVISFQPVAGTSSARPVQGPPRSAPGWSPARAGPYPLRVGHRPARCTMFQPRTSATSRRLLPGVPGTCREIAPVASHRRSVSRPRRRRRRCQEGGVRCRCELAGECQVGGGGQIVRRASKLPAKCRNSADAMWKP